MSSILGYIVQVLLAKYFGLETDLEAYLFALSFPSFISSMLYAMMSYNFIPKIVAHEKDIIYQKKVITLIFTIVLILTLFVLIILKIFISNFQLHTLPSDSPIRNHDQLPILITLACLVSTLGTLQGCLSSILNAVRRYVICACLGLIPNLFTILALNLLAEKLGIFSFPIGVLIGTMISILISSFVLRNYFSPLSLVNSSWKECKEIFSSISYTVIATSCFSAYTLVDAYWAPHIGKGALATLGYAQRILIGFGNLFIAGPSAVIVPRAAELVSKRNYVEFRNFFKSAMLIVSIISIALSLFIFSFSSSLTNILFSRGKFGSEELLLVASTLKSMAPGMFFMLLSVISMRILFCFPDPYFVASLLGMMWLVVYWLLSFMFHKYGPVGIANAYSCSWLFFFIAISIAIFHFYSRFKMLTLQRKPSTNNV
jgi:putative peptidoglycan lipid II flippase